MGALVSIFSGPNSPIAVQTLPMQKTGVQDGTSGLHYSGRLYTNQFQQLSADVCQGASATADQINDIMPQSISSPSLPVDQDTKRISAANVQGYVQSMVSQGLIPDSVGDFEKQMKSDAAFYQSVQTEYCFYEARYKAALTQFLTLASDIHGADQNAISTILQTTVTLNQRLNSLLEIINYVGNDRARKVNQRSPNIDEANTALQAKIAVLRKQQLMLTSSNARIETQAEMVRYSGEKNQAMNIQIMFFVALNVIALGTIITVYKSVRP